MNFLDLVKYTGTQTGVDTFTLTLDTGFQAMPQGVDVVVTIREDGGAFATVVGSLSGTTFTAGALLSSATAAIPTFTGNVSVVSTIGGELLDRNFGVGALVAMGQSNMIGWDQVYDAEIDYNHGDVTQFRYNWKDSSDTLTTEQEVAIAGAELAWARQHGLAADTVCPANHMAKALVKDGGHKAIEILPGAEGATAFGPASGAASPGNHWKQDDELNLRLVAMTTAFLNRTDTNYIAAVVMMLGESDSQAGMTEAVFSGHTDDFFTNFKADILAATGYDMTMTPFIIVGLNDSNIAAVPNSVNIEASMADAPNRITRCSFISMAGQTSIDDFHHTGAAQRNLGRDLFVPGRNEALANWQNQTNAMAANFNASATVTANLTPFLAADFSATATVTAAFDIPGGALAADMTATATMEGQITSNIVAEFNANVGVTANGSNQTSAWESINNTGHIFTNSDTLTTRPISSASGLTFAESNLTYMDFPASFIALANTDDDYTLIVEYSMTSDNKIILGSGGTWIAIDNSTTDFRMQAADGTETYQGAVTNDGNKHIVSYAIKRTGTSSKRVTIDGSLVNTITPIVATKAANVTDFIIGGYEGSAAFHVDGTIHNLYYTDEALTSAQINTITSGW